MLSAVRETVSSDVHLMLNFGCPAYLTPGWTAKDAVRIAGIAEKYNIFFLEEALKPDDVDGFAALTARANIKIATGESLTTLTEFQRFIDHRALDVIQPYAQQIGITQFSESPTAPSRRASFTSRTAHGRRWLSPHTSRCSAGRPTAS